MNAEEYAYRKLIEPSQLIQESTGSSKLRGDCSPRRGGPDHMRPMWSAISDFKRMAVVVDVVMIIEEATGKVESNGEAVQGTSRLQLAAAMAHAYSVG